MAARSFQERFRFFSVLVLMFLVLASDFSEAEAAARKKNNVGIYELKKGEFSVKVTNWGATILSVLLPDSKGNLADVALGFEEFSQYLVKQYSVIGALVGRVANRIANGRFVLNGKPHRLFKNDGNNTLHGGHRGFSRVLWTTTEKVDGPSPYITFYYHSFDGEQGFPGALDVKVTYKITADYQLSVAILAKSLNKPTPVNLLQHSYWNLAGHNGGTILSHTLQIFGSRITPTDKQHIPIGKIAPVHNTAYDFLNPRTVGSRISEVSPGYDINYVLDGPEDSNGMRKAALLKDSKSGRALELWTNQQGMQLYTGNFLAGLKGKGGYFYQDHDGLCLETQGFPDAVNHPNFPSQIVNPGEMYKHYIIFKFSF